MRNRPDTALIYIDERCANKRELLRARALFSDRTEVPLALIRGANSVPVETVAAEVL